MSCVQEEVCFAQCRRRVEKELQKSFKSFLKLSIIFCAAPVNLKQSSRSFTKGKLEKLFTGLQLIFALIVLLAYCVSVYFKDIKHAFSLKILSRILCVSHYIISLFILVLVIVGCQYHKKLYSIFFKGIVDVEINLERLGFPSNFQFTRIFLTRSTVAYTCLFGSIILIDSIRTAEPFRVFLNVMVYRVPNILSALSLTLYCSILYIIRDDLKKVNSSLKSIVKPRSDRMLYLIIVAPRKSFSVESLDALRKEYGKLLRLAELLNECFGKIILLNLIGSYVVLSTQLYEFYNMIVNGSSDYLLFIDRALWFILYGSRVFFIIHPNNDISNESKKTGQLIYQTNFFEEIKEPNVVSVLQSFASQIYQKSAPLKALNIITLDFKIVSTTISVLSTYLLILIQFDVSLNERISKAKAI